MTKQSGVIEKAWLEALMNSIDANANEFKLEVGPDYTHIEDDGDSMVQTEVERYFEQFGLKDDDIEDKEFGKFRMGRGQIFNFGTNVWRAKENYMVVNIRSNRSVVELDDCTSDDPSIIEKDGNEYTIDTEGLGYTLLDANEIDKGLSIYIQHYHDIEDLNGTVSEFKSLCKYVSWAHDIDVIVNGDEVFESPDVIEETPNAIYCRGEQSSFHTRSKVYNKGALVDSFDLGPRRLNIITKHDLNVTLDRTDILSNDEYWLEIQDEYENIVIDLLSDDDDITSKQRKWLIQKTGQKPNLLQRFSDKPLVEDIEGTYWSLSELGDKRIGFGTKGDAVAEDASQRKNIVVVRDEYEDSVNEFTESAQSLINQSDIKTYSEIIEQELDYEMTKYSYSDLQKKQQKNFNRITGALRDLGFKEEMYPGHSMHRNAWRDDTGAIFIDKKMLKANKKANVTSVLFEVVSIVADDRDSRSGITDDIRYMRKFTQTMKGERYNTECNFAEVQRKMLSGDYDSR
jgi:hypothetical protein